MGVFGKLETDVEVKASAQKFPEIFKNRPHQLVDGCPKKVQRHELLQGDWGIEGSVIYWDCSFVKMKDGKPSYAKEIIETVDEKKNLVTYRVIEGDLLEQHKNFKVTVHVSSKGDGSIVHWTFDYEKKHTNVPEYHGFLQYVVAITKDIDSLLCVA